MPQNDTTEHKKTETETEPQNETLQPHLGVENPALNAEAENPYPQPSTHKAQYEVNEGYRPGERKVVRLTLTLNIVLVIATIVLAFVSYYQWNAMNDALEETKRNRDLEYRAYVGVKGIDFRKLPDNPALGEVIVTYVNSGRTPALNSKVMQAISIRETPLPEDAGFESPDTVQSVFVIAPAMEFPALVALIPTSEAGKQPLTEEGQNSAKPTPTPVPTPPPVESRAKIYVYGVITYEDIFKRPHRSKFCYFNTPGTRNWAICPTHNSFD